MNITEKNKHGIDYAWGRVTYYAPSAEKPHYIIACGNQDPACLLVELRTHYARLSFDLTSNKLDTLARLEKTILALDEAVDAGIAVGKRQVRVALGIES